MSDETLDQAPPPFDPDQASADEPIEEGAAAEGESEDGVVAYDFRRPSRIAPSQRRTLDALHEQLAQSLQSWVSGRLRFPFEVHLESVDQRLYGDLVSSIPDPASAFIYEIRGKGGQLCVISLDATISFFIVEKLLGGRTLSHTPERALTPLERVVVQIVTDRIAREVGTTWEDHLELKLLWSRFEPAGEMIEMTGRDDDVLVASFRIQVEEVSGTIEVVLPFPVLESFFSDSGAARFRSPTGTPEERATERTLVERLVRQADTVVSARLPESLVSLRTLSALKVGDVLTTTVSAEQPVEVHISGRPRFVGQYGRLGSHLGVEIKGPIVPSNGQPSPAHVEVS